MDNYSEQIVTREAGGFIVVKKFAVIFLTVILAVALFLVFTIIGLLPIGLLLGGGCVYGGYFLFSSFDIEYEYIITNGELDVDKIIAKRSRKRLLTVKVTEFTDFGIITDEPDRGDRTIFMVTGSGESDYYADFKHAKHGDCRLIFSPNERTRETMEPYMRNINKNK